MKLAVWNAGNVGQTDDSAIECQSGTRRSRLHLRGRIKLGRHVLVAHLQKCRKRSLRPVLCLQCSDAVGWAAGRASGLQKN